MLIKTIFKQFCCWPENELNYNKLKSGCIEFLKRKKSLEKVAGKVWNIVQAHTWAKCQVSLVFPTYICTWVEQILLLNLLFLLYKQPPWGLQITAKKLMKKTFGSGAFCTVRHAARKPTIFLLGLPNANFDITDTWLDIQQFKFTATSSEQKLRASEKSKLQTHFRAHNTTIKARQTWGGGLKIPKPRTYIKKP